MRAEIHVGILDVFIFLGVFQGIMLSWFFIRNAHNKRRANLYQGLLLLFLSLAMFEEWLNNTGYIVQVLSISNFSEPLNFAFIPLFYFYLRSSLEPNEKKEVWVHFIPVLIWTFYMCFYFIQSDEFKYNSYVETKHPDWDYLQVGYKIPDDPLGIRDYVSQLITFQFTVYIIASIRYLWKKFKLLNQSLFKTENELLIILRNSTVHILLIIILFIVTKAYFGMDSDLGGEIVVGYVSFMIFVTGYQVLNRSDFFNYPGSFLSYTVSKYQKSSLSEEDKVLIMEKIKREMEVNRFFTNNLASLTGLSKQISESSHHVSQVINEKLDKNFFELLADYRVEYAKKLINEDKETRLTIEELSELVGYNSKSSFNTAFKKITQKTPSEYRKELNGRC